MIMTASTTCGAVIANDVFKRAAALFVVFSGLSFVSCPKRMAGSRHPLADLDARAAPGFLLSAHPRPVA